MELFFDHINGNLLLRGVIDELDDALSFPRPKQLQSSGKGLLGFRDAGYTGQEHHAPIPFHRPNVANAVPIELQLVFGLPENAFDRPALGIVTMVGMNAPVMDIGQRSRTSLGSQGIHKMMDLDVNGKPAAKLRIL